MKQELMGLSGPDYAWCRYGMSRTAFRGPQRSLDGRYVAFLGGTETFGKFLDAPFPDRVEARTGLTCVNFGAPNAGIDLFARDQTVLAACHDAAACVIQVVGVQNQTNRFYSVHPRRNDRFLRPSAALETLYPDIDFAEVTFTRHLHLLLQRTCPERFALFKAELQDHWVGRMKSFLRRIPGPKLLLWLADAAPALTAQDHDVMTTRPLFVTRDMVEALTDAVEDVVTVVAEPMAPAERCRGLRFHPLDRAAAEAMLGSAAHGRVAEALAARLPALVAA